MQTPLSVSTKFNEWVGKLKDKLRRKSRADVCDDIMRVMKSQPVLLEELK